MLLVLGTTMQLGYGLVQALCTARTQAPPGTISKGVISFSESFATSRNSKACKLHHLFSPLLGRRPAEGVKDTCGLNVAAFQAVIHSAPTGHIGGGNRKGVKHALHVMFDHCE